MLILLVLGVAGCGKGRLKKLRLATGGAAGTYFAYGNELGKLITAELKLKVTVLTTAASVENISLTQNGGADFAFVQNDILTYASKGTNFFESSGPQKNCVAVAGLYNEVCHIIAAGFIDDVSRLKGKRVSVGEQGSGTALNAAQILESFGMSAGDCVTSHFDFGASARALAAGDIDAFFCTGGTPVPAVTQLSSIMPIRLVPLGEARRRLLISNYSYYTATSIPSGTYIGVNGETPAVAVRAVLIVNADVAGDDVYAITKLLFENARELAAAHPKAGELNAANTMAGISVPFHEGALRYYREQGIIQ